MQRTVWTPKCRLAPPFEPLRSVGPKTWALQQKVSEAHIRFICDCVPTEEHWDDGGDKKEAAQYSEKVKYRFSRTISPYPCQSEMNSESNKQRGLKLKPILSMRSEDEAGLNLKILVEFVDNASGQMELKLTGRPYQQIWDCSGMLMCVLHFLRLLLGFQSALDDLLLTFSAARPYILVIIRLRMGVLRLPA